MNNARMGGIPPLPPRTQSSTSTIGATSNTPTSGPSQEETRNPGQAPAIMPNPATFIPPPMAMPPFPFSPPPFGIPPPMPPPNFSGLTTEELRKMEGNERENIEARVKCLRNVQVLLDAAVMEMQQYTLVVSKLNSSSNNVDTSKAKDETKPKVKPEEAYKNSANISSNSLNGSLNGVETGKYNTPEETGTKPKVKQSLSSESEGDKLDILAKMDGNVNSSRATSDTRVFTQEDVNKSAESREADEIRKRRLEKFSQKDRSSEGSN